MRINIRIPLKYLSKVKFSENFIVWSQNDKHGKEIFNKLLEANTIECKVNLQEYLYRIPDVLELFPRKWRILLYESNTIFKRKPSSKALENVLQFNWNKIKITYIEWTKTLSDDEYLSIWFILSLEESKFWISSINLITKNLSQLLKLIDLSSNWINIKSIILSYLVQDIDDEQTSIRDTKKNFLRKVGIIETFEITKEEEN